MCGVLRNRLVAAVTAAVAWAGFFAAVPAHAEVTYYERVSPTGSILAEATPLPVSASVGVLGTAVRWTRRSTLVTYGGKSLLEGQVVTWDGAVPDAEVTLLARRVGSSVWATVATRRTSSSTGIFRFDTHAPVRITDYRAVYRDELLYSASEATARVDVRRKISSKMTRNLDGTFTMSGAVAPRYAGKTVRLQRKTCSSCSWSTIKSATTYSTSTWRFRITPPSKPSTWYFRAYTAKDSSFVASYSGTWYLKAS